VALYRFLFAPVLLVVAALLGVGGRPRTTATPAPAHAVRPASAAEAPAVRRAGQTTPSGRGTATRAAR
jgi:hypothetical protein